MTCNTCGRQWDDTVFPTPAARCPFEYEHPTSIEGLRHRRVVTHRWISDLEGRDRIRIEWSEGDDVVDVLVWSKYVGWAPSDEVPFLEAPAGVAIDFDVAEGLAAAFFTGAYVEPAELEVEARERARFRRLADDLIAAYVEQHDHYPDEDPDEDGQVTIEQVVMICAWVFLILSGLYLAGHVVAAVIRGTLW